MSYTAWGFSFEFQRTYTEGLAVSHYTGAGGSFPAHAHDHAQLTWPRRGRVRLHGERELVFGPGEIGITMPSAPHAMDVQGPGLVDVVFFRIPARLFAQVQAALREHGPEAGPGSGNASVRIADATWLGLSSILEEGYSPRAGSGVLARACIEQCLVSALRPPASPARPGTAAAADRRLLRALVYLEDHLDERISLSQLAEVCNLSPHHFARRFSVAYGIPPHRYLVKLRMRRAALLFQTTDLNVTEVAVAVGYGNPGNFIRHFRRSYGATPRAYRQRLTP